MGKTKNVYYLLTLLLILYLKGVANEHDLRPTMSIKAVEINYHNMLVNG